MYSDALADKEIWKEWWHDGKEEQNDTGKAEEEEWRLNEGCNWR